MKPDHALFYLCSLLWMVNGILWQTLHRQTGLAILSMILAIGCAMAIKFTADD